MNNLDAPVVLSFIGLLVSVLLPFWLSLRKSRSEETTASRSATVDEVEALGTRLDKANERLDVVTDRCTDLETRLRSAESRSQALLSYIALDHAQHHANDWPVIPLPEGLA